MSQDIGALLGDLRDQADGLPPQLKRAAKYIVARPEEVALYSMRQLAERANVTPATMVRLAHAVGYDGFESLRDPFRDWLKNAEGTYSAKARDVQREHGERSLPEALMAADGAALADAQAALSQDKLIVAADALAGARRVFVLGLRSAHVPAYLLNYLLGMVQTNCELLESTGGTLVDRLRGVTPDDVLVVFGLRPYTAESVRSVDFAKARGARIIAVTDSGKSPLTAETGTTFVVDSSGPGFFHSMIVMTSMAQVLANMVVSRGGEGALERIRESEKHLAAFQAYWDEPLRRKNRRTGA